MINKPTAITAATMIKRQASPNPSSPPPPPDPSLPKQSRHATLERLPSLSGRMLSLSLGRCGLVGAWSLTDLEPQHIFTNLNNMSKKIATTLWKIRPPKQCCQVILLNAGQENCQKGSMELRPWRRLTIASCIALKGKPQISTIEINIEMEMNVIRTFCWKKGGY